MSRIRVLVVDDSLTVRRRIVELLERADGFHVVGEAGDGATAIALCHRLHPDVMTLDLVLPDGDGVAVTEEVMASCPVPILLVSGRSNRDGISEPARAIAAGAVALLDKPGPGTSLEEWERTLLRQIRILAGVPVIRRRAPSRTPGSPPPRHPEVPVRAVVLGASTGGPAALRELLERLPASFPLPVLAVIHTAADFDQILVRWLDAVGGLEAELARPGPLPEPGRKRLLIAPGGVHLAIEGRHLVYRRDAPLHGCRPAVDVLFSSAAEALSNRVVGCLLTGMGRDGAEGSLRLREAGAHLLVQDPASCVVGSMPEAAIRLGAASYVGTLAALSRRLDQLTVARTETP